MSLRFGVDVGGTKIEAIALDGPLEIARFRVPTPRDDYDGTVAAIAAAVSELERRTGGTGTVGAGIPGTISPSTGLVKNANSVWLIGRPLAADLSRRLGREVRIANDANCFTVSEAVDGAASGERVVFGVILGTGTGGAIAVDGRVIDGVNGIAGDWGHNPMPWLEAGEQTVECYCGKQGCIETYLSGPGLSAENARRTGERLEAPEIVRRAAGGDAACAGVLRCYESHLARALASIVNVVDPDVIVLGGGLSNIASLYEGVPRFWGRWIFSAGDGTEAQTRLVRAAHGDSSGVRGAAWLWP